MPFESRSSRDTHAIGKSPSLLWARTWQKQGGIQFIRRPVRVNPAGVVNAASAVRSRIFGAKCPMLQQNRRHIRAGVPYVAAIRFHRSARECWLVRRSLSPESAARRSGDSPGGHRSAHAKAGLAGRAPRAGMTAPRTLRGSTRCVLRGTARCTACIAVRIAGAAPRAG